MNNTPIRVLHMIAILEMGGSQSMVMNIYRSIDREKVQFDFIVDHPDRDIELRKEIESFGGKIYSMPSFKGTNICEVRKSWKTFFLTHREYKILHTHSRSYASIYLPIAKKCGLKTIAHSHSTSNGTGITGHIKDLLQMPLRYQADYLFACSKEAGEWLFGKKYVKSEKFRIIPNAIDTKRFTFNPEKRNRIREELGVSNSFIIGHVGRMTYPKNHIFLLKMFAKFSQKIKNAKLLLVGDGELMESIVEEAKNLGIEKNVIFVGSKLNTCDYYQAMDLFVFPSIWEGLGIAVIEAQASGLYCLVSDAVPKSVDVGAGLVEFLSLDNSWCKRIRKIEKRDNTETYIKNAGYDITKNANLLQHLYISLYN